MSGATKDLLDGEEVAEVLSGTFYKARGASAGASDAANGRGRPNLRAIAPTEPAADARPAHYKVICISLYNQDLERLDGMVDELKRRGFTKANRSALIRFALETADLTKVQKGM